MNYLAHLYLSGDSEEIKIGNFIGDYVKGKKFQDYPAAISQGILLHRSIDYFTDNHEVAKEMASLIKPGFGRYSGVIVDIYFDHFLAANWADYSNYSLKHFSENCHKIFLKNFRVLPLKVKQFVPFIILHKRFESYSETKNLHAVFEIMSARTSLPSNSLWAVSLLEREYNKFESMFRIFFEDIIKHVEISHQISIERPLLIATKTI